MRNVVATCCHSQQNHMQMIYVMAARGYVCIYQENHECLWYQCYLPHCQCRLIAYQYELEHWISYLDSLRKFDYGPAHASSNHVIPTFAHKNGRILWKSFKVVAEIVIKQLFHGHCIVLQSLLNI